MVLWKDIRGAEVPDIAFKDVRPMIGKSGRIRFSVKLKDGSIHIFEMTSYQLEDLYSGAHRS